MKRRFALVAALAVSLLAFGMPSSPAMACSLKWNGSSWSCI